MYLNCIMDLFARKIIAWTLSDNMEVSSVINTINKAKTCRNTDLPLIIHSNRGNQYVSNTWRKLQKLCRAAIRIVVTLMTISALNLSIPCLKENGLTGSILKTTIMLTGLYLNILKPFITRSESIVIVIICRQINSKKCMKG